MDPQTALTDCQGRGAITECDCTPSSADHLVRKLSIAVMIKGTKNSKSYSGNAASDGTAGFVAEKCSLRRINSAFDCVLPGTFSEAKKNKLSIRWFIN